MSSVSWGLGVVFQDRIRGGNGYGYGLTVATGSNMGRVVGRSLSPILAGQ